MSNHNKGNMARQLANAPINQELNNVPVPAIAESNNAAMPIEEPADDAPMSETEPAEADKPQGFQFTAQNLHGLPMPLYKAVENAKTYEDARDKSKSNTRVAEVGLRFGAVEVTASIYLETQIRQTSEGRFEDSSLRFSPPKGVKIVGDSDQDIALWKDTVIDGFLAWREMNGGDVRHVKAKAGVRTLPTKFTRAAA